MWISSKWRFVKYRCPIQGFSNWFIFLLLKCLPDGMWISSKLRFVKYECYPIKGFFLSVLLSVIKMSAWCDGMWIFKCWVVKDESLAYGISLKKAVLVSWGDQTRGWILNICPIDVLFHSNANLMTCKYQQSERLWKFEYYVKEGLTSVDLLFY